MREEDECIMQEVAVKDIIIDSRLFAWNNAAL
jgi:hypothetical protein